MGTGGEMKLQLIQRGGCCISYEHFKVIMKRGGINISFGSSNIEVLYRNTIAFQLHIPSDFLFRMQVQLVNWNTGE